MPLVSSAVFGFLNSPDWLSFSQVDQPITANAKPSESQSTTETRPTEKDFSRVYALAREHQKIGACHILLQEKRSDFPQTQSELQDSRLPLKEESTPREDSEKQLRKQILFLQREKALYTDQQKRRYRQSEDKVKQLEALNKQLNRQIGYLRRQCKNSELGSLSFPQPVTQQADPGDIDSIQDSLLALADKENLQKGSKIKELSERLGKSLTLNNMLEIQIDQRFCTGSVNIRESASSLNYSINRAALSMARCLKPSTELTDPQRLETKHPELLHLIQDSVGSVSILFEQAIPAIRALISYFVRGQVFYSDIWTSLERGDLMLEEYRKLMRQGGKSAVSYQYPGRYPDAH